MTPLAAHEAIPLELPGASVPVLLFAGGTTGLVLLAARNQAVHSAHTSANQRRQLA